MLNLEGVYFVDGGILIIRGKEEDRVVQRLNLENLCESLLDEGCQRGMWRGIEMMRKVIINQRKLQLEGICGYVPFENAVKA
jgi:hypothetical protein